MTYEEAARILDPETSRDALLEYGGEEARLEACNEACRMAAKVLREPQAVRLDETGAQALALAAEVSELRQELEAAKTLQDAAWISVKERLPEDDVMVLCVVLPAGGCSNAGGEKARDPKRDIFFYPNNPVTRYISDTIAEKLTREEAEAALKGEQHG